MMSELGSGTGIDLAVFACIYLSSSFLLNEELRFTNVRISGEDIAKIYLLLNSTSHNL
jgi:hypothetical protein